MKFITYAIYEILKNRTDEEHELTTPEILSILENEYDISITRQTLKKHFELLEEVNIEISEYIPNKGYHLITRDLEPSEVSLLCHVLYSSHFITDHNTTRLIHRLLSTQSKYFIHDFNEKIYIKSTRKSLNKEFFYNLEIIEEAINKHKQISFGYLKYDKDKHLILKDNKTRIISPYHIIFNKENVYLLGSIGTSDIRHFRIDRITNIILLNKPALIIESFAPYEYAKTKLFMFSGKDEQITFAFDECILDAIIDEFGKDVNIIEKDNTLIGTIKASIDGMYHFALQYSDHLIVQEPESLRMKIKDSLSKSLKNYD